MRMKNVGSFDASVRLVLSLAALYFGWGAVDAITKWGLYAIALILIWTAVTGNCMIYSLLGVSTCETKPKTVTSRPAPKVKAVKRKAVKKKKVVKKKKAVKKKKVVKKKAVKKKKATKKKRR